MLINEGRSLGFEFRALTIRNASSEYGFVKLVLNYSLVNSFVLPSMAKTSGFQISNVAYLRDADISNSPEIMLSFASCCLHNMMACRNSTGYNFID